MEEFLKSDLFHWFILPSLIVIARIIDVSMGTVRMILVTRGARRVAPILGFFEVIIWLLAIGQIMQNLTNIACYVAFGVGYAAGTYAGMLIEHRLSIGKAVIRIITNKDAHELIERLRAERFGVTAVDAQGAVGPVKLIFSIIERRDLSRVVSRVKEFDAGAFYTIGDVKFVSEGVFPQREPRLQFLSWLLAHKK